MWQHGCAAVSAASNCECCVHANALRMSEDMCTTDAPACRARWEIVRTSMVADSRRRDATKPCE